MYFRLYKGQSESYSILLAIVFISDFFVPEFSFENFFVYSIASIPFFTEIALKGGVQVTCEQ